ncbi:hypothetical protein [Pseudonocardia zijingensis]|uniref:Uncharacterized protein n=1 Tax=Pseudonocardia zijingensis TaxID=153376 RepID=A0ABN1QN93_9PSEU
MLLKLSPLILMVIAGAAIILRSAGLLGDLITSIVVAILILIAIAIGIYRSVKARRDRVL